MLCDNRYPLPGSPSTCIIDSALIPLPSFLLVIALPISFLLYPYGHRAREPISKWIHWIYFVLVIAAWAMNVLEISRLVADHQGVGLTPMILVGLIITLVLLGFESRGRTIASCVVLYGYWILNMIFQSVRVARLKRLEDAITGNPEYPTSDQLLDNAVVLGLYVVFVFVEAFVLTVLLRRRRAGLAEGPKI